MSAETGVEGLRVLSTNHNVAQFLEPFDSLARAKGLTVFARIDLYAVTPHDPASHYVRPGC
jgi:hypothetical protein